MKKLNNNRDESYEKEIEICRQFLEKFAIMRKNINFNHPTYEWRDAVERWYKQKSKSHKHISSSAFIVAAFEFGLRIYARPEDHKAFFNLSEKCWRNHL